jgi:hypothetical protein
MSIDLYPQDNPNLVPRDQVRVETLTATPYPDGRRVKVEVTVTPFRERPNLEISVRDADGKIVASASAIGIMNFTVAFTLHLRGIEDPAGDYTAQAQLYYDDPQSPQDARDTALRVPPDGG